MIISNDKITRYNYQFFFQILIARFIKMLEAILKINEQIKMVKKSKEANTENESLIVKNLKE